MKRDKHGRKMPERASLDLPARRFWDGADREQVELALSAVPDKYDTFLRALHDPEYLKMTIPAIMRKFDITLHEVQTIYTNHQRQRMLMQLSNGAPQVGADVVEDAQSRMMTCPRCDGEKVIIVKKGKMEEFKRCPDCKGTGEVKVQGSDHSRDLVFTAMGLIKQGGPLVAIQQNFGADAGLDARMESQMKLTQQITMGKPATDPVEEPSL